MSVFSSYIDDIPKKNILVLIQIIIGSNPGLTGPIVVYIIRWYVNISRSCDNTLYSLVLRALYPQEWL